jgi:DNA polymerase-3 subunit delta
MTEADTVAILEHNREESPFTLFDTLGEGDLAGALEILRKLSLSKDSSPVQTLAGLTYCFRRLVDWHLLGRSGPVDDFSLKKAGFASKRAVDQYRRAAQRWDLCAAQRILALLSGTDLQLRSLGTAVQDVQMDACIYSILEAGGRALAVAEYS